MSCIPPVTGRVNAIKSQFENLSSLESLDISGCKSKRSRPENYNFQRAATSIDLLKKSEKAKKVVKSWATSEQIPKQSSDSFLLRRSNNNHLDPSNELKRASRPLQQKRENVEVKLSRHTSDPVKRSSIKRSPAFRIGDKQNKTVLVKQGPILPKEFDENKIEGLLTKCVSDDKKLKQPGLTDSLRAALRQPLPTGPPPKKPPRIFETQSQVKDECVVLPVETSKTEQNEIKDKINFLESNLLLKNTSNNHNHTSTNNTNNHNNNSNNFNDKLSSSHGAGKAKPFLQKSKTEFALQGTKFLNFISCHKDTSSVIYDAVAPDDSSNDRMPLLIDDVHGKHQQIEYLANKFPKSKNPSEHIYMEPFSHLSNKRKISCPSIAEEIEAQSAGDRVQLSSAEQNLEASLKVGNLCHCPENHSKNDLHYLCSPIDDSGSSLSEVENNEKDGNLALKKTYDEITILVNAAFQQHKSSDSETSSMGNRESENADNKSSIKLHRSLTEKRKDYVRRIAVVTPERSQIHSYGSLHKTFKSPILKTFSLQDDRSKDEVSCARHCKESKRQEIDNSNGGVGDRNNEEIAPGTINDRINKYKKLVEENTSTIITTTTNNSNSVKFRPKKSLSNVVTVEEELGGQDESMGDDLNTQKLFQVCILVGYNLSSNSAYLKSKYPPDEPIPDNIEQLIFPSNKIIRIGRENQDYYLILTDDNGFKVYGYCRRVLPENSDICLPLAYCVISVTKALGFYQKLLREIESRHGQTDSQLNFILKSLQNLQIPNAGKFLHLKIPLSLRPKTLFGSNHKISPKRLSLEANPKWLTESAAQAAFADHDPGDTVSSKSSRKSSSGLKSLVQEFEEKKHPSVAPPFDLSLINRSLIVRDPKFDEIFIRRPNDLRLENTELSDLLNSLGPELLISVFSTLLLERKVILQSQNISLLSKSVLALQSILYPFQWQYTIVTILPLSLIEICQAPFPVLAGVLDNISFEIEDGIAVDLDNKRITQSCGDEQTILPDSLRESLQLSLEMVDLIDQGKMLSSVLISEAFLRFFVVLFGEYRQKYFHKEEFIQMQQSQKVKFFLEWFVETSMFRHLVHIRYSEGLESTSLTGEVNFYDLFDARLMEKSENNNKAENIEKIVKNSKIINKKGKTFKERFKDFLK